MMIRLLTVWKNWQSQKSKTLKPEYLLWYLHSRSLYLYNIYKHSSTFSCSISVTPCNSTHSFKLTWFPAPVTNHMGLAYTHTHHHVSCLVLSPLCARLTWLSTLLFTCIFIFIIICSLQPLYEFWVILQRQRTIIKLNHCLSPCCDTCAVSLNLFNN